VITPEDEKPLSGTQEKYHALPWCTFRIGVRTKGHAHLDFILSLTRIDDVGLEHQT
jgi:hypothetical protein